MDKIILNESELKDILTEYYCTNQRYEGEINIELDIKGDKPSIDICLLEKFNFNGRIVEPKLYLTKSDLIKAFNAYLKCSNLEVEDFRYIGGIHRSGYYFDEDFPYFEGIEITPKQLIKTSILSLK